MKTKKTAALILAGMLAAALAGCQNNGGNPSSSDGSAPAPSSATPSSQSTPSSQDGEKNHVITVLGKDRRYDCAPFSDRDSYPVWQEVEKLLAKAGVTCEFDLVPKEQYDTVIKTRMAAASDLPDVVGLDLTDQEVLDMGKQGLLIDVKEAIDQYSNGNTMAMWNKYWPNATKKLTTPEGKIYWYTGLSYRLLNGELTRGTGTSIQYRKDWLDALKLDAPTTTEELYGVLKAFRDGDANGNGVPDEIALCSIDSFSNGIAQCYGLAPKLFDIEIATDKAVTPWTQPGIKPYLEYMKKLVAEGIIDASLIGANSEVSNQKISENKAGLVHNYVQQNWLEGMTGVEDAEYIPILPVGVEGINPVFRREPSMLVYQRFGVTKNCKDVEGVVALFDALYSDEYAELSYWGVEGVSFELDDTGRRVKLHLDYSDEQLAEIKALVGHSICGNVVFPVVNIQEEWADTLTASGVSQAKQDFEILMQTYEYDFETSQPLAMPTDEERAAVDQYYTTLETYSQELLVNIILGNKPIEELDAAIEEMKAMGLDEVLAAYQSRHDRYTAS